jgi:sporulation protein YlmC with PRC-barrel domain
VRTDERCVVQDAGKLHADRVGGGAEPAERYVGPVERKKSGSERSIRSGGSVRIPWRSVRKIGDTVRR